MRRDENDMQLHSDRNNRESMKRYLLQSLQNYHWIVMGIIRGLRQVYDYHAKDIRPSFTLISLKAISR